METVVKALYNASFTIWNTLMELAMTLFSTSPVTAAGGSPYGTVHSLYNSISAATIPIATCFFVIAIYKSVITSPPEQQAQRAGFLRKKRKNKLLGRNGRWQMSV